MKKYLSMIMVVIMAISLMAGCGTKTEDGQSDDINNEDVNNEEAKAEDGQKMVIGMSCINLSDAGLVLIKNGADKAAEDYNCELVWKACEGNLDTQIDQIRGFIQQGVDAIWIDSCDVAGVVDVVNEATDAGIIVMTAGSKVEGNENYNLVYPDYDDAYFAATVIGERYKDQSGTIGLIVGNAGNLVSENRQQGYTDAMKNYPNLKLVTGMGMWDANTSMTVAEDLIRSNPDMLHMHIIADGMSYGAYEGIKNAGGDVTISSNDGDTDALAHLENGEYLLDNVVGNERLGYWGIVIGHRLYENETMVRDQFLPTYKVMGDEMIEFIEDNNLTEINSTAYELVTIEEARKIVSADAYTIEFNESFVPTK